MEILGITSARGELRHLVSPVWKEDEYTYHLILENPTQGTFLIVTLDVRALLREAVLVN